MYYNLWNICKVTSHCFSDCSLDQGTFKLTKWQLRSKCPSSYSTLKVSMRYKLTTAGVYCTSQPERRIAMKKNNVTTSELGMSLQLEDIE